MVDTRNCSLRKSMLCIFVFLAVREGAGGTLATLNDRKAQLLKSEALTSSVGLELVCKGLRSTFGFYAELQNVSAQCAGTAKE